MDLAKEMAEYIKTENRPVGEPELLEKFKSKNFRRYSKSVRELREEFPHQRIKGDRRSTFFLFFPKGHLEDLKEEAVPGKTVSCKFNNKTVYLKLCHDHCKLFNVCKRNFKDYFENQGKEWKYENNSLLKFTSVL